MIEDQTLARHGLALSVEELVERWRITKRPIHCDPMDAAPGLEDSEMALAEELERHGVEVLPPAKVRARRLGAALRKNRLR